MGLVPLEEAQGYVTDACSRLAPATAPLAGALGQVSAERVVATEAVPPFDNSAVDGYAVRAADTTGAPVVLSVVATLAAGSPTSAPVGPGEAIRIMTGAPVPEGADAVVMVEDTSSRREGRQVEVRAEVSPGAAIRRAGEDLAPGDVVVDPGTPLTAAHLGVLASVGVSELSVFPRARVGVLSTGDELVSGPAPLLPGQIRDSNRPTLLGMVAEAGCEAVDLGSANDDEASMSEAFDVAARRCDAVVTSGGVSMGDFDLVKVVLDRLGDMRWMQVAVKPAKPLAFGVIAATPVFGLPGNPVSSMVSFELFARPALRKMMGFPPTTWRRPLLAAVAEEPLERRPDGKTHLVRVIAVLDDDGRYRVRPVRGQGSHQLAAMASANALAVLGDGGGVARGEPVRVMVLSST